MKYDILTKLDERATALAHMYIPYLRNKPYYPSLLGDFREPYISIVSQVEQALLWLENECDPEESASVIFDIVDRLVIKIWALVKMVDCLAQDRPQPEDTPETSQDAGCSIV